MRRILRSSAIVLALGAACARQPGSGPSPVGAASAVTPAEVSRVLSALAHDSLEGRGTGTRGEARAARFIADEFRRAGLEPVGDSGFFQRVPLVMRRRQNGRMGAGRVASFAVRDTFPAELRGISVNVLGVLRGTDPVLKDSIILVDAHYDHVGVSATPVNGDSIFNGADDDASGVTAVIEIARQLAAGPRPKRTILFAATTGEEAGLIGTRWYIEHPVFPNAAMQANLEIEMIGRPDSLSGGHGKAWLTGFERSTMGEMFKAAGLSITPDMRPSQNFFMRSDNIAFARMGIPAHTLSSFNLHKDYHQVTDEVAAADFSHMAAVINAAVKAVELLANGPAPRWNPGGKP